MVFKKRQWYFNLICKTALANVKRLKTVEVPLILFFNINNVKVADWSRHYYLDQCYIICQRGYSSLLSIFNLGSEKILEDWKVWSYKKITPALSLKWPNHCVNDELRVNVLHTRIWALNSLYTLKRRISWTVATNLVSHTPFSEFYIKSQPIWLCLSWRW